MGLRGLSVLLAAAAVAVGLGGCGSPKSAGTGHAPTTQAASSSYKGLLPASIRSAGKIVAGAELTVPPIIFYQANGTTISGVNYDLAQAMAKSLGVPIVFQQFAFPGLEPAEQSGKIDVIFDVINDTPQREQLFNFVDYLQSGNTLLTQYGNPSHLATLADMCGKTMAAVSGSVQIALVSAQSSACTTAGKPAITIKQYPSAPTARLQVQTGVANAFIGNTPVLLYLAKTAGGGKLFQAVPLTSTTPSYYGIAVAKSDTALTQALLKSLQTVFADGTYTKILDRYGIGVTAMSKPLVDAAAS